jgi:hypothetical protein
MTELNTELTQNRELEPFLVKHPLTSALEGLQEYELNCPDYWSRFRKMLIMGTFGSASDSLVMFMTHVQPTIHTREKFACGECSFRDMNYQDWTKISAVNVDDSVYHFVGSQPNGDAKYIVPDDINLDNFMMSFEANFVRLVGITNILIREADSFANCDSCYPSVMRSQDLNVTRESMELMQRLGFVNEQPGTKYKNGKLAAKPISYVNTQTLMLYVQELKNGSYIYPGQSIEAEYTRKVIDAVPDLARMPKKVLYDMVSKIIKLTGINLESMRKKTGMPLPGYSILAKGLGEGFRDKLSSQEYMQLSLFEMKCVILDDVGAETVYAKLTIDSDKFEKYPHICRECPANSTCNRLAKHARGISDEHTRPEAKTKLKDYWSSLSKALAAYNCIVQI